MKDGPWRIERAADFAEQEQGKRRSVMFGAGSWERAASEIGKGARGDSEARDMPVKNNAAVDPRSKPRLSWGAVAAKRKRKRKRKPAPGRNPHQPVRRPAVRPNTSRLRRGSEPVSTGSWA